MDGEITVKSQLGCGTEFRVDIYVEASESDKVEYAGSASEDRLKNDRILLVEDNEINIYVAQAILEKAGCKG